MDINKKIVKSLLEKNYSDMKDLVFKSLYAKASLLMDEERVAVADVLFNEGSGGMYDDDASAASPAKPKTASAARIAAPRASQSQKPPKRKPVQEENAQEKKAEVKTIKKPGANKDINSGAYTTPANKKRYDASYSEYIKQKNNRTDSKGNKLDPYDDYES